MNCVFDKRANLTKYLKLIDEAANNQADLIVLPEQSLQAYLTTVAGMDMSEENNEFRYQYDNAEVIPDGPSVKTIIEKAKERNIYVVFGMTEKDSEIDYKLYNTSVLVGPEGYIGSYRKVHQPCDEYHVYYHGNDFPVFDTAIGKIGMMVCYDQWFPESSRELALRGAEIIIMPTATAYSGAECDCETDEAYYYWDLFNRARALENQSLFISSNQIGVTGLTNYFGHSNIVNPRGKIMDTTGCAEGIAYYETKSIKDEIFWGKNHFIGLNYLKDRRPSAYKMMCAENPTCNNL